jgi:recombinational DNA repair protein (RecF pathway)
MRPRYNTSAIVLARTPLAEASALLYTLTSEFGLVKVRAQGVRKPGAKLAPAVQTLIEHDAILVRGKDGWRLSGAVPTIDWFRALSTSNRSRAGRVGRLLLRLVQGETTDTELFILYRSFIEALTKLEEEDADTAEHLIALRLLKTLGLDAGNIPGEDVLFDATTLTQVRSDKRAYIMRINRGISASGL